MAYLMNAQRLLHTIDGISTFAGKAAAWLIMGLMTLVCVEVFKRYIMNMPTAWIFDASNMMYGSLFMLCGAYTLAQNGHVRGDFVYRNFRPTTQAKLDLTLYVLFFFPAIFAFMISGWSFFTQSFAQNERSAFSPSGPVLWPFKLLIPIVGVLLLLQGLAEVARCIRCIRTGAWPARLSDVEELEQTILAAAEAKGAEALAADLAAGKGPV